MDPRRWTVNCPRSGKNHVNGTHIAFNPPASPDEGAALQAVARYDMEVQQETLGKKAH
jgi:hypothetical protein